MKPWHIMQFKLEELLEKISIIDHTNEEVKEFGDYLIANILICKEIAEQKEEIKENLWNNVKEDLEQILNYSLEFLKEQEIK